MWRIEIYTGRWWTAGWIAGPVRACLAVLDTYPGTTRLVPVNYQPWWTTTCPACKWPTVHYAGTHCRCCDGYEEPELEWWQQ